VFLRANNGHDGAFERDIRADKSKKRAHQIYYRALNGNFRAMRGQKTRFLIG
jgi:hypothetical protein